MAKLKFGKAPGTLWHWLRKNDKPACGKQIDVYLILREMPNTSHFCWNCKVSLDKANRIADRSHP